jgi:AcrR family transcriptional regulator
MTTLRYHLLEMSMPYELEGRTQQKQRTRAALVAAARDLVARGLTPTVEDAASAASISRTTAYRYFPSQRALLAAAHPETAAASLLPANPPEDAEARLELVVKAFTKVIADSEAQQRTMLRLSLEAGASERGDLPLRQGRAIAWITEALEPLRPQLGDEQLHRLVLAIRSATGIEALIWLTDIAGLSRREAVATMRWSAAAMCRSAIVDGGPRGR